MKNRIKLTSPLIKTRAELDEEIGEIRAVTLDRNQLIADRDHEKKAIDDRYGPDITRLNELLQQLTERVKVWADGNPEEFGGKRSIDTTHGTLGWRMGQWQCAALAGWIWARTKKTKKGAKVILDKIKELTAMKDYIRVKEEVDKDAIIADRGVLTAEALSTIGVRVFQEESFYVEPKVEEPENRQTATA
jgi:phage host-nuclease inhibitor protein Gam